MRIIKSEEDIYLLRKYNVLEKGYLKQIEEYFRQLFKALSRGESYEDFRMGWPEGFLVILEKGDNLKDLETVGLNYVDDGLLGAMPEFVEEINLKDFKIYKINVLLDNECMMTYFTKKGIHDKGIESWLLEQAEINKNYGHNPDEELPF